MVCVKKLNNCLLIKQVDILITQLNNMQWYDCSPCMVKNYKEVQKGSNEEEVFMAVKA